MAHLQKIKIRAEQFRKRGISIPKIAERLGIARSTIFCWVRNVKLPFYLQERLERNSVRGRERGIQIIKARHKLRRRALEQESERIAKPVLDAMPSSSADFWKLCAALLFWCEGSKCDLSKCISFANSDPNLMRLFLHALRSGFKIEEKRLRVQPHLHEYHDEAQQRQFWSRVTGVPLSQFNKTYQKPHTKKRIREGYPGCISLRYYDSRVAQHLATIYHKLGEKFRVK